MNTVVLEPHNDDSTLFCAFAAIREQATIVTVLQSFVQASRGDQITADQRTAESRAAAAVLGVGYEQWPFRDDDPDWQAVEVMIRALAADRLYVPVYEENGHPQHNLLYRAASEAAGPNTELVAYLTYTRNGKSKWGTPVAYEPEWVPLKMRALCCYESQAGHPLQAEHFLRSWREYLA